MLGQLDDDQRDALRRAATALAQQDGRGLRRAVLVELPTPGLRFAVEAEGDQIFAVAQQAPGGAAVFMTLTAREREVAGLLAAGLTNPQIADALTISVATVKDHVHRILQKTGLRTRAAVASAWHGFDQSA